MLGHVNDPQMLTRMWSLQILAVIAYIVRLALVRSEELFIRKDGIEFTVPTIALVSGFIGAEPAFVPRLPHPTHDCYFITNNVGLGDFAAESNWKVIHLDIPVIESSQDTESDMLNSANSKPLKVHPQNFLPKQYDYIIWFDNKYQLLTPVVLDTIVQWDSNVAMMLPPRPECCGADLEFKAAMMQPRYAINKVQIENYMDEQVQQGYPVHGERHMRSGFVIYNMNHPDTQRIQDMWQEHIDRAGAMCQIALYFVVQRFPVAVQEYKLEWHEGLRHGILVTYDDA